jgi:hypothetical protein
MFTPMNYGIDVRTNKHHVDAIFRTGAQRYYEGPTVIIMIHLRSHKQIITTFINTDVIITLGMKCALLRKSDDTGIIP